MSSFSIRDILDLPEDTIRSLQAIKPHMGMSSCTITDQRNEASPATDLDANQHGADETPTSDGTSRVVIKRVLVMILDSPLYSVPRGLVLRLRLCFVNANVKRA
jgi:hypothetical protein